MIVYPVLNFVLPLMLTTFLLVSPNSCIECKNKNIHDSEKNSESVQINQQKEESDLKDLIRTNKKIKTNNLNVF